MKLLSKIFIQGKIKVLTGLHIGQGKENVEIGGLDLAVIKRYRIGKGGILMQVPYIPGSSLKGKLRSMLARKEGSEKVEDDIIAPYICEIFGRAGKKEDTKNYITRLIVRDADLNTQAFENDLHGFEAETAYTDTKTENTIQRDKGSAQHPRTQERVPAGAKFDFQFIYDEYDDEKTDEHLKAIAEAMRLLQDDYLGGSGTRGYGRIEFENVVATQKEISDYESGTQAKNYQEFKF